MKINKYLNSEPKIAKKIVNAIEKHEIYMPIRWQIIMFIINLILKKYLKT